MVEISLWEGRNKVKDNKRYDQTLNRRAERVIFNKLLKNYKDENIKGVLNIL